MHWGTERGGEAMTLPSQGTVLSQKLLAGGVRAGGGLVPWLNVTSQCHSAVPVLCLCCQHHQLLPRDRWMWPHPLALTSSLLLLPFTRAPNELAQSKGCSVEPGWPWNPQGGRGTPRAPLEWGCGVCVHPLWVCGAAAGPSPRCLLPFGYLVELGLQQGCFWIIIGCGDGLPD